MKFFATLLLYSAVAACGSDAITPPPRQVPDAPDGMTSIATIQGRGDSSPLVGQEVVVEGVVSGDFQDNDADRQNNLGGFYLQQESPDQDPQTSDGVFVFDGNRPSIDVDIGDRVIVEATVAEFFGETQLQAIAVRKNGRGLVLPSDVQLPTSDTQENSSGDTIADLERYEGMLLHFPATLTVTNLRSLERFGAITLSQGGRLFQFSNFMAPDAAAYAAHQTKNATRSIELDDGQRNIFPNAKRYLGLGDGGAPLRAGNTVTGLTGNLRYSRGSGSNGKEIWRLMPTIEPAFVATNPRPVAPEVAGALRVASFNVLNFFSSIDNGQSNCGPQRRDNCRGADNDEELTRHIDKMVSALAMLDADIIGLMELENNSNESIAILADALNGRLGAHRYAYIDTGNIGDDAIKTGFLYNTATVEPRGLFALLDRRVDERFDDRRNRPALAQTFQTTQSQAILTVVVNHLKSKGSSCEADGDPNANDGQGNCNLTRTRAATALADWVRADPTNSGDTDFLIIGDLNAYTAEDPLTALANGGFENLLDKAANPYTLIFDGQAGALDHALASATLLPQIRETRVWHINADEPAILDYNLENDRDPALFDGGSAYRSSDHDPVVIGLDLTR